MLPPHANFWELCFTELNWASEISSKIGSCENKRDMNKRNFSGIVHQALSVRLPLNNSVRKYLNYQSRCWPQQNPTFHPCWNHQPQPWVGEIRSPWRKTSYLRMCHCHHQEIHPHYGSEGWQQRCLVSCRCRNNRQLSNMDKIHRLLNTSFDDRTSHSRTRVRYQYCQTRK